MATPVVELPADYVTFPESYHLKARRIVGLLSCQMNPLLRSLDSVITRIDKKATQPAKGRESKKLDKNMAEEMAGVEWEIEFEDTVIFPAGGGQPGDHGTLTLKSSDAQSVSVIDAFRRNLDAVHIVRFPASLDPTLNGWNVGSQVYIEVAWHRRMYHMQQHTGQHVLSAVFEHELKNNTMGWQLSQSNQPSYVDLERSPTEDDIAFVICRSNEVIHAATRVRVSVRLDSDQERPDTLPEDYRDGVVRCVNIDGLDQSLCCGTHHPSLAFLGSVFIFPGVTKISGPTRFRIYFVVGNAVLQHLAAAQSIVKDIGTTLECGPSDILERAAQLQKAKKDSLSREKVLKAEASRALAFDLISSLRDVSGTQIAHLHREEESTDIEFLGAILHAFQPPTTKWLVALSSGPFATSNGSGGCLLIASSDEGLVKKAGELVKTKFQGRVKGGGKGRWQGKIVGNWEKSDRKLFSQIIHEAVAL